MAFFVLSTALSYVPIVPVLFILYAIVLGVCRIYFSALSHIPGPKLAAATRWYEVCHDAFRAGKFYKEMERMHEEYGPIVRITPFEVHISDPNYFNELYNMKLKLHKDPWFYSWLDRNDASFATTNPDLHKLRSAPIKKGLSQAGITRVEHVLKEHVWRLLRCIERARDEKEPLSLEVTYRSLTTDIVTDISCPKSMALLESLDRGHRFHDFVRGYTIFTVWNRHFPWINPFLDSLPRWVVALQGQVALAIYDSIQEQKVQARDVIRNDGRTISNKDFPVIMNEVYKSKELPPREKTPKRLFEEIAILIGAGSETTSWTLLNLTYHVLSNTAILKRLQGELREKFTKEERKGVLSYKQLEDLPYLTAVVTEGLRIGNAVCGRLPRINHSRAMTYTSPAPDSKTYTIPPGSTISMSIRDMHYNPECFPSPLSFDPERFLGDSKAANMQWFAAFGRGPRSCVGRELAWAELYMVVGNLFAKYDVKLAEGVEAADVRMEHECFAPFIAGGRKGVWLDVLR